MMKAASDFVGAVLGETQNNTRAILKELCVGNRRGVMDWPAPTPTRLRRCGAGQGVPGEDRCVVMLRYRVHTHTHTPTTHIHNTQTHTHTIHTRLFINA